MDKVAFIKKYLPVAMELQDKLRIPAIFSLAQSALETGWGKHAPGNMMFGVKAGSSWKGKRQLLLTTEFIPIARKAEFQKVFSSDGRRIESIHPYNATHERWRVRDWFRAYDTPYQSFEDWAKRVILLPRYKTAFNFTNDSEKFAAEVVKGGYATDPNYLNKILSIMREIVQKKNNMA